jgi:hypothetical protein
MAISQTHAARARMTVSWTRLQARKVCVRVCVCVRACVQHQAHAVCKDVDGEVSDDDVSDYTTAFLTHEALRKSCDESAGRWEERACISAQCHGQLSPFWWAATPR